MAETELEAVNILHYEISTPLAFKIVSPLGWLVLCQ